MDRAEIIKILSKIIAANISSQMNGEKQPDGSYRADNFHGFVDTDKTAEDILAKFSVVARNG